MQKDLFYTPWQYPDRQAERLVKQDNGGLSVAARQLMALERALRYPSMPPNTGIPLGIRGAGSRFQPRSSAMPQTLPVGRGHATQHAKQQPPFHTGALAINYTEKGTETSS
ncbi:uncharacterized [Tachysurus ichikawai]